MTRGKIALTLAALLTIVAGISGQTARQTPARDTDPIVALTAEFRALRAELAETARASLRLQLLTARLQAQEQRIIYLDRQRTETVSRRTMHEQALSGLSSQLQGMTPEALSKLPAEQRRDLEQQLEHQKRELARQEQLLGEYRVAETDAENALSQEQARWGDLNSRLEELERSLR